LGEILELVNQLAKQMVKFGPFLSALMKYQSPSTAPRKKRHEKSYISGFGNPDEKMITNALMGLLIPILLINLTRKSAI
ncbi:MAG TPA: hypothetical protein VHY08_12400, partial [Bacillota bacterium]|nr:hypothetical protein [Bacillota bacterium]